MTTYTVTLRFQFPAWDEVNGIVLGDFDAASKSEAIKKARWAAKMAGHIESGARQGRVTFSARESTNDQR